MSIERARVVIFLLSLATFGVVCLGVGLAIGKEYQPDTREALLIRPEKPVQRVPAPQTCNDRPAKPQRVMWVLRDASGNIIIIGSTVIRRRC